MSKIEGESIAPTMIIPNGTEIQVDNHGQLSISAPGNLVIQNSGSYGTIESRGGSIRIEPNVEVEAVQVRCADACYVQGNLTAWKLASKSLQLEDTAQAHIVLQETDRLEIGKNARLVGNFDSEKELFLLFSRFGEQLRSLPFYFDRSKSPEVLREVQPKGELAEARAVPGPEGTTPAEPAADPTPEAVPVPEARPGNGEIPENLFFALVLLERDAGRGGYGPTSQRVLDEIIKLLQDRDFETLRHTYRTLFRRIVEPRDDVARAYDLVDEHFGGSTEDEIEPVAEEGEEETAS